MTEPKEAVIIGPNPIIKGLTISKETLEQIREPQHSVWTERRTMAINKAIGWVQYYPDKGDFQSTYILILDDGGNLWKEGSLDNDDMNGLMDRLPQIFVKDIPNNNTNAFIRRAKIPGGWLVTATEDAFHDHGEYGRGVVQGCDWRTYICFVPDPNHEWVV